MFACCLPFPFMYCINGTDRQLWSEIRDEIGTVSLAGCLTSVMQWWMSDDR